ncbi:MAG: class I SAM-dependent methyltransferase, partial [Myxococcales bacterium]
PMSSPSAPDDWRSYDAMEARLTRPVTARMLELAGLAEGRRVLDVGCGTGEAGLAAAPLLGTSGFVLGIDLAEPMLALAREKASRAGAVNVAFHRADAQELALDAAFDVALARWSLMYVDDPERALERIRRSLVASGRLVAAFWAEPARVEFAWLPREVLSRFVTLPPEAREGRGVFRFADEATLQHALRRSGFTVELLEELRVPVVEAPDGEALLRWVGVFGGGMARAIAALEPQTRRELADALTREAEPYRVGGTLQLGGVTRLVVARP